MNAKMKSCFTPHVLMHALMGFGLGMLIAALVAGHQMALVWVGIICVVVAFALDMMRKKA